MPRRGNRKVLPVKTNSYRSFSFNLSLPVVREGTGDSCRTPADVRRLLADTADLAQEAFTVITLNRKNKVIDRHMVTLGLVDASLVSAGVVFRPAIEDSACAVILSHNHPSSDPSPSSEDLSITRRLVEAGKILDIRVLDHVIVGRGERDFFSLRESGIVSFE
jgi:DNA repair protein RadC